MIVAYIHSQQAYHHFEQIYQALPVLARIQTSA
jgi:hypothetical protein